MHRFPFRKSAGVRGRAKNQMSSAYSRHSRTLAPGAPLVVGLDVRLHPVLHHAADGARHHISAPVSVTQNTKSTWEVGNGN